ncbi:hypothetical protein F2P56_007889, partial [Juglans regia]
WASSTPSVDYSLLASSPPHKPTPPPPQPPPRNASAPRSGKIYPTTLNKIVTRIKTETPRHPPPPMIAFLLPSPPVLPLLPSLALPDRWWSAPFSGPAAATSGFVSNKIASPPDQPSSSSFPS